MKKRNPGVVFIGMGFEAVFIVIGSVFVGEAVDKAMGWHGLGVAIVLVLGLVAWFVHMIVMVRQFMKETSSSAGKEKDQ